MTVSRQAIRTVAITIAVAGPATADEVELADANPFASRWVASLWMGAPAGVGYAMTRTVGQDWQVSAVVGMPLLITGIGGGIDVVRGTRFGPVTVWLGATLTGYSSDNCSWGGCGEFISYYGAGPQLGIEATSSFVGKTRLVANLGAGVALAFERSDNLARYQPLGALKVGVGW